MEKPNSQWNFPTINKISAEEPVTTIMDWMNIFGWLENDSCRHLWAFVGNVPTFVCIKNAQIWFEDGENIYFFFFHFLFRFSFSFSSICNRQRHLKCYQDSAQLNGAHTRFQCMYNLSSIRQWGSVICVFCVEVKFFFTVVSKILKKKNLFRTIANEWVLLIIDTVVVIV